MLLSMMKHNVMLFWDRDLGVSVGFLALLVEGGSVLCPRLVFLALHGKDH